MTPLILALAAIGLTLLLVNLWSRYRRRKIEKERQEKEKRERRAEAETQEEEVKRQRKEAERNAELQRQEMIKKNKMKVIRERGGMLAAELSKCSGDTSNNALEILYIAATQQAIHFDLATERSVQMVSYPTADLDFVQITEASQLPYVMLAEAVLEDDLFYHKFVTQDLIRPEYYDVVETLKRLYILLDISRSMFDGKMPDGHRRETWARGVVASLLVEAVNGKAEYVLQSFDDKVHEVRSSVTAKEAEVLLSRLVQIAERGNSTEIGNALESAGKNIRERQSAESRLSHILLITDGEDDDLTAKQLDEVLGDDIKLHVVLIGTTYGSNHPLTPYVVGKY